MKTTIKALTLALCAVLLVVSTVFATLAYLTSTTELVTNTFTVGNVTITLDEAKVTEYGDKDGDTRVTENTYKLLPGHFYTKDPTIHVKAGSEPCYVFVKVTNDIAAIEATGNTTVAAQMTAKGWVLVSGTTNVYCKEDKVDARTAAVDVEVFSSITIATEAEVSDYTGKTITVIGYAVQADGFASAADAWAAAPADWNS